MQLKLIIFNMQITDSEYIYGFKILPAKQANNFKKAIKLLEQNQSMFSFGQEEYIWNLQFFDIRTISTIQAKILNNVFELDIANGYSNVIGTIPDAIDQAYQQGLLDDDNDSSSYHDEDEQDD